MVELPVSVAQSIQGMFTTLHARRYCRDLKHRLIQNTSLVNSISLAIISNLPILRE